MSNASKSRLVNKNFRYRPEKHKTIAKIQTKESSKVANRLRMNLARGAVAQCRKCKQWFGSFELRNAHFTNNCKPLDLVASIDKSPVILSFQDAGDGTVISEGRVIAIPS